MKKLLMLITLLALVFTLAPGQTFAQETACETDTVVQADDWLSKLADKFLGDVLAYPAIVQATNQANAADDSYATIDNPDVIEVGWKLCIPSVEEATMMMGTELETEVLKANLEAQRLTIEAASVYRQYLKQQAAQVRNARKLLEEDIATAWNTYETVRVSGELVDLVKSSQQLLDGLLQRQVPTLQPFRNLEMQREFAKLTKQLRTSQD
jgi:hypothetical protein